MRQELPIQGHALIRQLERDGLIPKNTQRVIIEAWGHSKVTLYTEGQPPLGPKWSPRRLSQYLVRELSTQVDRSLLLTDPEQNGTTDAEAHR